MNETKARKENIHFRSKKELTLLCSLAISLLILFLRPLDMTWRQSGVCALLVLVIIWWCTGAVNKTLASCVLIVGFLGASGAPVKTVLAFPLSDTFPMIALTYLFSQGVKKSGLAERYLEPLLWRYGNTPVKILLFCEGMLILTIYAIPQPLARLIIIADIVKAYLDKSSISEKAKSSTLFGIFVLYIFTNMLTRNADIILNTAAVSAAGLTMSDWEWMRYMAVPSLLFLALVFSLFLLIFRRDLGGAVLSAQQKPETAQNPKTKKQDLVMLLLIVVTMLLWLTESLHGIPSWLITLCSVGVMLAMGDLKWTDWKAIDIPMLVFLTAAMCIGGVLSASGVADALFSVLRQLTGAGSSNSAVFSIMLITICMHMILGSNTTTLSVVIPGLIYLYQDVLPLPVIAFTVYIASAAQWLLPFHSVGLMMGTSKQYYTPRHILKMGIPLTGLVFLAMFALYLPWWRLMGFLG